MIKDWTILKSNTMVSVWWGWVVDALVDLCSNWILIDVDRWLTRRTNLLVSETIERARLSQVASRTMKQGGRAKHASFGIVRPRTRCRLLPFMSLYLKVNVQCRSRPLFLPFFRFNFIVPSIGWVLLAKRVPIFDCNSAR